jgi:hypothetical protein
VGADQDFEAFLREWTEERIWPVDDFLDYRDRRYMEERRSAELTRLAQELDKDNSSSGLSFDMVASNLTHHLQR